LVVSPIIPRKQFNPGDPATARIWDFNQRFEKTDFSNRFFTLWKTYPAQVQMI
jgi:hypothetical protein